MDSTFKNSHTRTSQFPVGGGEMGNLIRSFDWSGNSLGPIDSWPLSLRTIVNLLLSSRFPMFLWWGTELIQFYNDAYRPSMGNQGKHPTALGQRGADCWPEIWPMIKPLIDQVLAGGESTWSENQLIPIYRNGQLEDVYWTFSYSSVTDDSGEIAGVLVTCTETTEEMLSRQSLLQSQERFHNLVNQAPVAIALFRGPQFIIELANGRMLDYWGHQRDQVMNKPLFEALPELELEGQPHRSLLNRVLSTGKMHEGKAVRTEQLRKGQPGTYYYDLTFKPLRNATGEVYGILAMVVDVTDQVMARQELEESELFSRNVFFNSPVAKVVFVGEEMVIRTINENMLEMMGRDASIIGLPFMVAMPEFIPTPLLERLQHVFTTGETYYQQEERIELIRYGEPYVGYYNYIYKPLYNTAGAIYGVMVTATEITRQVEARDQMMMAQAELLLITQRLTLALDAGKLGSYDLDVTTGLMDCTPQFKFNFGRGSEDPFNFEDLLSVILDEDRPLVEQAIAQALETHTVYHAEYRIKWPDESLHWIKASGMPAYSTDDQPIRIIGVAQEITAQRQLQLALEQQVQQRTEELGSMNEELTAMNDELEVANQGLAGSIRDLQRSNRNLEQFAYIASHDLQEPLRKIQSFSMILQDQYGPELGESGKDLLQRMMVAGERMSALIRDLLTFSRISTRQDSSALVALDKVIKNALVDLDLIIQETGAVIEVKPMPSVQGDFSQLSQLFLNLFSNALKFRRAGNSPHIEVSAHRVRATDLPTVIKPSRGEPVYHRIDVADNGIGFDNKYLDRIFQIFQRLHGRSEFAGTGIGLAICEKVTTNHGGAITAQGQPGEGATFSVYLPDVAEAVIRG